MAGIQPRVAPTMNYGVVGSTVYGDIVDSATQLMGIVAQGRRDKENAEFRREGLEFQKTQAGAGNRVRREALQLDREGLEFQKTQAGVGNQVRLEALQLDRDRFAQSQEDKFYDNVIKWADAGRTFPGSAPEGSANPAQLEQEGGDLAQQIQVVNTLQRYADTSHTVTGGKGFDPKSLELELIPFLKSQIDPGADSNPGFDMTGEVTKSGGLVLRVDKQTYDTMDPGDRAIYSVIGATPSDSPADEGGSVEITPEMLSAHLGREVSKLSSMGKQGLAVGEAKLKTFSASKATSPTARRLVLDKRKVAASPRALSTVTTAYSRIGTESKRLLADPHAVSADVNAAEVQTRAAITGAYATYQDESDAATTTDELSSATRKLNFAVVKATSGFTSLAAEAQRESQFKTVVEDGKLSGAFNQMAYAKSGSPLSTTYTQANAEAAAADTLPLLTQQFSMEGRADFIKDEAARLAAPGTLSAGQARDGAVTAFNRKVMEYTADAAAAAQSGHPINSRSLDFMQKYTPRMLDALQLNDVSSYLTPEDATEDATEEDAAMAGTYGN